MTGGHDIFNQWAIGCGCNATREKCVKIKENWRGYQGKKQIMKLKSLKNSNNVRNSQNLDIQMYICKNNFKIKN